MLFSTNHMKGVEQLGISETVYCYALSRVFPGGSVVKIQYMQVRSLGQKDPRE